MGRSAVLTLETVSLSSSSSPNPSQVLPLPFHSASLLPPPSSSAKDPPAPPVTLPMLQIRIEPTVQPHSNLVLNVVLLALDSVEDPWHHHYITSIHQKALHFARHDGGVAVVVVVAPSLRRSAPPLLSSSTTAKAAAAAAAAVEREKERERGRVSLCRGPQQREGRARRSWAGSE